MLNIRHGMVIDTYADDILSSQQQSRGQNKPKVEADTIFLNRQGSLSILLRHLEGLSTGIGVVQDIDIFQLITHAKLQAIFNAEHQENWSPDILIDANGPCGSSYNMICIPSIVRFALLEAIKNALSSCILATNKFCKGLSISTEELRDQSIPIQVTVDMTDDYISVRITDQGLGMRKHTLEDAYSFLALSSLRTSQFVDAQASYQPMSAPLQGLGAGVFLSNMYLGLFGGKYLLASPGLDQGATATILIPRSIDIQDQSC